MVTTIQLHLPLEHLQTEHTHRLNQKCLHHSCPRQHLTTKLQEKNHSAFIDLFAWKITESTLIGLAN